MGINSHRLEAVVSCQVAVEVTRIISVLGEGGNPQAQSSGGGMHDLVAL